MDDLISRQAAIDAIDRYYKDKRYITRSRTILSAICRDMKSTMDSLPSAQPERKKGRWLIRKGISDAQCSECKMYFKDVYDIDNSDAFCRHCGAKMEGLKVVKRG